MANEAVMLTEDQPAYTFVVANATAFEKGALCTLTSPLTATAASADGFFAGVVKTEKIANVGTSVSLYRSGLAKMTSSAAIAVGAGVTMTGSGNKVKTSTVSDTSSKVIGIAMSTTSADNDTLIVDIRPGANPAAYA